MKIVLASALCLAQASFYAGPPANIQLTHDGQFVKDTPEVAHAKAAHFAAYAQASSAHGAWAPGPLAGAPIGYAAVGHYGAPGAGLHKYGPAPLAHDGRVIDTPEVAHLKAEHAAAHSAALHGAYAAGHAHAGLAHAGLAHAGLAHGGLAHAGLAYAAPAGYAAGYGKWHGPPAHIELTHDGQYVKDTPEVAHARAAHLAQYAHVAHAAAAHPEDHYGYGWH